MIRAVDLDQLGFDSPSEPSWFIPKMCLVIIYLYSKRGTKYLHVHGISQETVQGT